jgi:hypothetical protein
MGQTIYSISYTGVQTAVQSSISFILTKAWEARSPVQVDSLRPRSQFDGESSELDDKVRIKLQVLLVDILW